MTNHIHLAVIPLKEDSLASGIGYSHRLYAQRFNKKYNRQGHLWETRFYSCPLDEAHFIRALIYIDRNPVRIGIVSIASEYRWSSARTHSGKSDASGLIDVEKWSKLAVAYDWDELMRLAENEIEIQELRDYTYMGKSFVSIR
jgi:putative transposase